MSDTWTLISSLVGGIGLFLLGMGLMTDSLKLAGGFALKQVLAKGTRSRILALLSGFSITALVQSSTAVTVMAIGFVNAGLMQLSRSIWVLYGSNVGTTMTAWIVALIGFKIKVDVVALPAIGLGVLFYTFSKNIRFKSLGGVITGLGLLFFGLQLMQQSFSGVEQVVDFSWIHSASLLHLALMVFVGALLTAVMQSSSASLAVVLTAVSTGMLTIEVGAAAVIGANIGTTLTALLAVLNASANARRLAFAHLFFNVVAALIAFVLMGAMLSLISWLGNSQGIQQAPAVTLAMFHTIFNVVGVLAMVPLTNGMTRYLNGLFQSQEEQLSRPRFLDKVTAESPDNAVKALSLEQQRLMRKLGELLQDTTKAMPGEPTPESRFVVAKLISAINDFIADCSRREMTTDIAETMQHSLRVNSRSVAVVECLRELHKEELAISGLPDQVATAVIKLRDLINKVAQNGSRLEELDAKELIELLHKFEEQYNHTQFLLGLSAQERNIEMRKMERTTLHLSLLRRATRQYTKALLSMLHLEGRADGHHLQSTV